MQENEIDAEVVAEKCVSEEREGQADEYELPGGCR